MSLLEKIKADALAARKARNTIASDLLVTLSSEAAMVGKSNGNRETTDAEVIAIVKKFMKNADETLKALPEGDARRHNTQIEYGILNEYLPKQLTEAELEVKVNEIIDNLDLERSKKSVGAVMKELKACFDGCYDGKTASMVVGKILS